MLSISKIKAVEQPANRCSEDSGEEFQPLLKLARNFTRGCPKGATLLFISN